MRNLIKKFAFYLKPKFYLTSLAGVRPNRILDIGIANESYMECKAKYPKAEYHGLDLVETDVIMGPEDLFFLRNLENKDSLTTIGFNYDLIIANHVLEHVERGEEVFGDLCKLLSENGVLYVEMPSIRCAFKKKNRGNYHFHDDPTHQTFYPLENLANIAIRHNCKIISCGPVSTWLKDLLSLPRAFFAILRGAEWGPYLIHMSGKVDHIMVIRK